MHTLVTFGFNFEQYDEHILEAISKATKFREDSQGNFTKLYSIYFGVYSEQDAEYIESIRKKFRCKVNIFDSKPAVLWG